ncbi:chitobiase/beta-hexosaminidase C-terminal domain-containing protein [Idiomarina xiamenensis]|uniref:Fibronectin type-III domain-containing protein n=1 Tax=Idiomarina xiamenensis 10-D-4 TaxID=740709 RepID=K2K5P9_9GAMM|nr:chitobiase/beta-hexosaminidase C-terminal domain-containing protein [Idiomarina xiamenensis]EKE82938.1 hypothetical protein A10D4_08864 [Idiomarina xiamenensis 10-D-4]
MKLIFSAASFLVAMIQVNVAFAQSVEVDVDTQVQPTAIKLPGDGGGIPSTPSQVAPVNFPSSSNTGSFTISWKNVGASVYELWTSTDNKKYYKQVDTTRTSYKAVGMPHGKLWYRVTACNSANRAYCSHTYAGYTTITLPKLGAPTASPSAATRYNERVSVTLKSSTSGADIYYALNNSPAEKKYSAPLTLTQPTTIKFRARKLGYQASNTVTKNFNVTAAPPSFSINAGTYVGEATLRLSTASSGATIHVTNNGQTSTYNGSPIRLSNHGSADKQFKITAWTSKSGTADSAKITNTYTVKPTYAVTTRLIVGGGTLSPTSRMVERGKTATFTVTSQPGYMVNDIVGCGGSLSGNTYKTAAITAPCEVGARFIERYEISTQAGSGGTISPTSRVVKLAQRSTFSIKPNSGYRIALVTGCGGQLSGTTYSTGAVADNCQIKATFIRQYQLTAKANAGGAISPTSITVDSGQKAVFQVTPNNGYRVLKVSGCGGSLNGNRYTSAAASANCQVEASFIKRINVAASVNGPGRLSPDNLVVDAGSSAEFTVLPNSGAKLVNISGCQGVLLDNIYRINTVTSHCTVQANFARWYRVQALASQGGTVSPSYQEAFAGEQVNFTIHADDGYQIKNALGCDGVRDGSHYKTAPVAMDCQIRVYFESLDSANEVIFIHSDLLGSPIAESDQQGVLQ